MLYFAQQFLNGLHSAALYGLLAFGYGLINGMLHRTNLAHGAIFAFAGQVMILATLFGWDTLWLAMPAAIAFGTLLALALSSVTALVLSREVLEPLAGRNPNAVVVATLGVSLMLMELGRLAAETRDLWLPPLLATPVVFVAEGEFRVTLTVLQLLNCALSAAAVAGGAAALATTAWGRRWRAVSDDPKAAAMVGVNVGSVFRAAVLLGSLAAAVAGLLAGLYFGNIGFGTGLAFGLKVLFLAAVGGYAAPAAAALGAALFGIGESLWSGYFPLEWRDAWMFAFLVALLVLRGARESGSRPG